MAGGSGAVFQVNGFRGGRLPSRDEIRQIRFRTNSFSADNHDAGRTQIEIITRPNVREWNGNGSFNYRGDAMNAPQRVCGREDARAEPQLQPRCTRPDRQRKDLGSPRPRRTTRLPGRHHRRDR
jgi:hypothetical protein